MIGFIIGLILGVQFGIIMMALVSINSDDEKRKKP